MVSSHRRFFSSQNVRLVLDDQNGEMSSEMIYTLLQSAASELERSTEVKKSHP